MQLLKEILNLFECEILLKSSVTSNKIDLFNQIRAISGIVVVNVIKSEFLEKQKTQNYEFSLIKIKYTVSKDPYDDVKQLGNKVIHGDSENVGKVEGILQFLPRLQTIKKVR